MPTSNFKLFDENKANMMDDSEYGTNQQRLNGVQTGVASSQLQNKTLYQVSLMSYALGQLMVQNGYDCSDTAAVTTFVNNLGSTLLQKVVDKASDEEAKAGVNNSKYITPATMKAALDVLSADVDEKISDTKEYVDSKLVIPKLVFPGRTFKIVNTGKVNMNYTLYMSASIGGMFSTTGQVEFNCIVGPSGTLLYGNFPEIQTTYGSISGYPPYVYALLTPVNGFVAMAERPSGGSEGMYFSYRGQVKLLNESGVEIGTIYEMPTYMGTTMNSTSNRMQGTIIFGDQSYSGIISSYNNNCKLSSFGCYANFPGFLCLN